MFKIRTIKFVFLINFIAISFANDNAAISTTSHPDEYNDISNCCSDVYGSCRTSCENFSLVQLAADPNGKDSKLSDVRRFCSTIQTEFWTCMNKTLHAVSIGSQWSGRLCCPLALSPKCQHVCATSGSRSDLSRIAGGCRQSDEQNLFSCFDRQDVGDECCGNARTSECLQACRDIFRSRHTPDKGQRMLVERVCSNDTNSKVLQCVQNITNLTSIDNSKKYLPCCEMTQSSQCRTTCRDILNSNETIQEMIDGLERGGCGPPLPYDPLWQCFLSADRKIIVPSSSEGSQINHIGMDSAKLHCCHKAFSPKCRRLCVQTFSNDWTEKRVDFELDCYAQISELPLRQCLDEVDEPCELGCDGLSFCTNFNNRPTELFRSCNAQADHAAQADVLLWQEKGFISLPGLNLPIKDILKCSPDIWKAIVCTLQVKPCTRSRHANQICREDCYDILTKCMDWTKLNVSHTAATICSKLSFEDSTMPCISLKPFTEPSDLPHHSGNHNIVTPCKGHPCNASEVCLLDRDENVGFTCVPGCSLGETSSYMVPYNTFVRIPVSFKQKGCFKICKCGLSGRIEHCQPLPCFAYDSCSLSGRKIEHSTWFYVECNICSCFAGEITCTKKQCRIPGISDRAYTSLPCNCPPHHVPVCGRNGNTYPSACVAKCTGLQDSDIEFGACSLTDPCENVVCPSNGVCVENRQICLSAMHRPCQQYQCVNATQQCQQYEDEVCSREDKTYSSLCHLVKSKVILKYRSACFANCRNEKVCGFNGVTYRSECEAWSDYVMVDYVGDCKEVGLLTDSLGSRCTTIICKPLPSEHCDPVYPPGACCPICSGAVRIIYSRKQIDRALYALKGKSLNTITLRSVFRALDRLIRTAQCRLFGFLTMETDLFVTVQHSAEQPSYVQIEACVRELEKVATLIASQSHRITSNLALSSLTVANVMASSSAAQTNAANNCEIYANLYFLTIFLMVSFRFHSFGIS